MRRQGAPKYQWWKKGGESKAVGRSSGGLNTKIYAVVDGLGNSVEFMLSLGNDRDSIHAIDLLSKIGKNYINKLFTLEKQFAEFSEK